MPKTVQLSDDAYANLRAVKREGESFSDTVNRLIMAGKDPLLLLDLGKHIDPSFDFEGVRARMDAADRAKARTLRQRARKRTPRSR